MVNGMEPAIDIPRHARLVGVGEVHEALDPLRGEEGGDLLRLGRILELPRRALGEPAPNRPRQSLGMQMRVDVDVAEARRRLHQARTTQRPGQPTTSTPTRTFPAFARRATAWCVSAALRPKRRTMRAGVEYTAPPR